MKNKLILILALLIIFILTVGCANGLNRREEYI